MKKYILASLLISLLTSCASGIATNPDNKLTISNNEDSVNYSTSENKPTKDSASEKLLDKSSDADARADNKVITEKQNQIDINESNDLILKNTENRSGLVSKPAENIDPDKLVSSPAENIDPSKLVTTPGENIDPGKIVSVIKNKGLTYINFKDGDNQITIKVNFSEFTILSTLASDNETHSLELSLNIDNKLTQTVNIEKQYFENQKSVTIKITGLKDIDNFNVNIAAKDKNNKVITDKQIMNEPVKGNQTKDVNLAKETNNSQNSLTNMSSNSDTTGHSSIANIEDSSTASNEENNNSTTSNQSQNNGNNNSGKNDKE